ncbi:hypothetical protein ACQUSR_23995 [Streptomyces sp. P1-3]|uniref:hypothetical protein n=1 Tax=Streptomyces sp. P1-3 TaxID=3421658 RepID=UPI003D368252
MGYKERIQHLKEAFGAAKRHADKARQEGAGKKSAPGQGDTGTVGKYTDVGQEGTDRTREGGDEGGKSA